MSDEERIYVPDSALCKCCGEPIWLQMIGDHPESDTWCDDCVYHGTL